MTEKEMCQGNIIYDPNNYESVRKQQKISKIGIMCLSIFLISVASAIFYSIVYIRGNYTLPQFTILALLGGVIGTLLFISGVILLHGAFFHDGIRIYENGICLGKKRFILFQDIETLYPNENRDLEIITFRVKEGEIYGFSRTEIHDLNEFIHLLEGKVKIVTDVDLPFQ